MKICDMKRKDFIKEYKYKGSCRHKNTAGGGMGSYHCPDCGCSKGVSIYASFPYIDWMDVRRIEKELTEQK